MRFVTSLFKIIKVKIKEDIFSQKYLQVDGYNLKDVVSWIRLNPEVNLI